MKTEKEKALEIAEILTDYKGVSTVVIDVSQLNSWTNYFVITTVNSGAHWRGLYKQIKDYDWNLIDMGSIVVHLMSPDARSFYDLEKLWHGGKRLT